MPYTADEYERFAKECIACARNAKTEIERNAFLDMARAWTLAAAEANKDMIGVIPWDNTDSRTSH
jgi:hypothetical protein